MALRLHHMNVCGDNVQALKDFYGEGLGLQELSATGNAGDASVVIYHAGNPDELQVHVSKRQVNVSFDHDQALNPLAKGHFCFRTDDLNKVIENLNEYKVPFADYGNWESDNWRQIFVSDPAGNVIEIQQVGEGELPEFTPEAYLRLHHVNVCGDDVDELNHFYKNALGLERLPSPGMTGDDGESKEWGETAQFFHAGDRDLLQLHATVRRPYAGYENGQAVNGLANGHFAFRTDDIDGVIARLQKQGIPFSDYERWAIKTWRQLFLPDPAGNIVEIHQVDPE